MSTQYGTSTYCSTNQNTSHWEIPISLTADISENNYITPAVYNQMFNSLKQIHDFGESDSATRLPDIDNKLNFETDKSLISVDFYNDIARRINYTSVNTNDSILGSYFSALQKAIEDYKLPDTRYYTYEYYCCDDCGYSCHKSSGSGGGGCSSCNFCISSFDNPCSTGQENICHNYSYDKNGEGGCYTKPGEKPK